ncbi:hypothetical protein SAMN06265795_101174 [Noviherbaspirillum humi]|uniref:AsmA domain-containing protein n=1 Tax=Noviherbaspirillum humi TaxID=1688639 RepID=A0A239C1M0_9BURK|nr:AsmA family protein [Noviherbaspirillum humi]SNS13273.1 hypothetical protein SAMN06265795_101174 [Noviherbaspirillum humi]
MSRLARFLLLFSGLLAASAAAVAIALAGFDWDHVRPWLNNKVTQASGRQFEIRGKLALVWRYEGEAGFSMQRWMPWPRLTADDVHFGNPAWASSGPDMLQARRAVLTLNPLALVSHQLILSSLVLEAPQLVLERDAQGRANWQLENPPQWKIRVNRMSFGEGSIRYIDARREADISATVRQLDHDQDHFRVAWDLTGNYGGAPLTGSGKSGNLLTMRDGRHPYPLTAELRLGQADIKLQGSITQPFKPSALDLQLEVSGKNLSQMEPILRRELPAIGPFATEGHLVASFDEEARRWTYEKFSSRLGKSKVSGNLHLRMGADARPKVEARLEAETLDMTELARLFGEEEAPPPRKGGKPKARPVAQAKMLPAESVHAERLTAIDADIEFQGRKIVATKRLTLGNVSARVRGKDGLLALAPLKLNVAEGSINGELRLDGRQQPAKMDLKASLRELRVRQLFPGVRSADPGRLSGDIALSGRGDSVASLLASSDGKVSAVVSQGTISQMVLEQMGLNVSGMIATKLFGDRQVRLNCGVADLEVAGGIMTTRSLVADTEESSIYGEGRFDFGKEEIKLELQPETKGMRLISLSSPLEVSGSFTKPSIEVDKTTMAMKAGSALALGVLAPVAAAVLPLINIGSGEGESCASLIARTVKPHPAPAPMSAEAPLEQGSRIDSSGR